MLSAFNAERERGVLTLWGVCMSRVVVSVCAVFQRKPSLLLRVAVNAPVGLSSELAIEAVCQNASAYSHCFMLDLQDIFTGCIKTNVNTQPLKEIQ